MTVEERLRALSDEGYADFQAKLTPGVPRECFIGVRVPVLRAFAKEFAKEPSAKDFLSALPHPTYDENMLHGLLVSGIRDFGEAVAATERFLPFVDNWSVCDIFSPKVFAKHKKELLPLIRKWAASDATYTCRFGIEMLMSHFLDGDFSPELLEIPLGATGDDYYVRMMQAWFYATALAKQWDATLPILTEGRLPLWVHNKTITKACESYRITEEQKTFLRSLRR